MADLVVSQRGCVGCCLGHGYRDDSWSPGREVLILYIVSLCVALLHLLRVFIVFAQQFFHSAGPVHSLHPQLPLVLKSTRST